MRYLTAIIAIVSVWSASSVLADEGRLDQLIGFSLILNLEKDGVWQISNTATRVEYDCLECIGEVSAKLEIIAPYTAEKYGSLELRYLADRKAFCAQLVVQSSGRCLKTVPSIMRGGALSGFRSRMKSRILSSLKSYFSIAIPTLVQGTGPSLFS